jgi:hypothetical protein
MDKESRKGWYDHKSNGFGIKYEIASNIKTGDIVHYYGPLRAAIHDLTVFQGFLKRQLAPNECVIADKGYIGDSKVITPRDARNAQHKRAMAAVRMRHEHINGRLKKWKALGSIWRHALNKHHLAFRALLVITQVEIENGRELHTIEGYKDPFSDAFDAVTEAIANL